MTPWSQAGRRAVYLAALLLVASLLASGLAASVSQEKAKSLFERYCSVCHDGVHALSFQQLLERLRGWAARYPTLDAAVQKEYGAPSYKALMDRMKKLAETKTGMSIPEADFNALYQFFKQYFEEAKKMPAPATATTVTLTTLKTVTTTSTAFQHVTVTVKRGAPGNTARLLSEASLAAAVIIAIAAILIAYRLK